MINKMIARVRLEIRARRLARERLGRAADEALDLLPLKCGHNRRQVIGCPACLEFRQAWSRLREF